MEVRRLKVSSFRGIASLDRTPGTPFCCLICCAGDSSISTLLDAIKAAMSSRWFSFTEPANLIIIETTVGKLSKLLKI